MSTTFTIKHGDTVQSLVATLSSTVSGVTAVVDLTAATEIKALFERHGVVVERACVVVGAATLGVVSYSFDTPDWVSGVLDSGTHRLEFRVTFAPGDVLSIPTSGFCEVVVEPNVFGA